MARNYLVTFDLAHSWNRQNEYNAIRNALRNFVGAQNYFEPVKQCCLVRTRRVNALALRQFLANLVAPGNVLVLRLQHGFATDIANPIIRQRTREWLRKIS